MFWNGVRPLSFPTRITEAVRKQDKQLARRMKTTQSVIARLESGRTRPSTKTLEKLAKATGTRLKISFEATEDAA